MVVSKWTNCLERNLSKEIKDVWPYSSLFSVAGIKHRLKPTLEGFISALSTVHDWGNPSQELQRAPGVRNWSRGRRGKMPTGLLHMVCPSTFLIQARPISSGMTQPTVAWVFIYQSATRKFNMDMPKVLSGGNNFSIFNSFPRTQFLNVQFLQCKL